jgi:hypothetical protein
MNPLNDYRQNARKKYEEYKIQKDREEREEQERLDRIKKEEELKKQEIIRKQNEAISITLEIDDIIDSIQFTNDYDFLITSLISIESLIKSNKQLLIDENKIKEIQNSIINLINILNMINENKKNMNENTNLENINNIHTIMKGIFELIDMNDINIEVMDTTEDEEYAKKLHDQLNNLNI